LNRAPTNPEVVLLGKYLDLLEKWQKTRRLVGSSSRPWLIEHVVIDSLRFLELIPAGVRRVVDVGSGAGIPGVPIAVVRPSMGVVMVEAMRWRVSFLSTVIRELALTNASVVESRLEELGPEYDRSFDSAVMRCAGKAQDLVPSAMRLVRSGGTVIVSGPPAQYPMDSMGGEVVEVHGAGETRHFRRWTV
jgi:16S rRNA (guanine527-N7)-methyltransferase